LTERCLPVTETRVAWDINERKPLDDPLGPMRRFCEPEITRASARQEIESMTAAALDVFNGFFGEAPILVPILRAGMAMWTAADTFFGQPHSAFVVARKTKGTTQVDLSLSSGLDEAPASGILILDTVSATGDTIVSVARDLRQKHARATINALVCYASPEAISAIGRCQALNRLGVAVRAEGVDPHGWLLPKIGGDAGEKLYGMPK